MDCVCAHCSALHFPQERLKSSSLRNPRFGECCKHGAVSLPPLQDAPEPLHGLLAGDTADARRFLSNIRAYNCAFQLASNTIETEGSGEARGGARGARSLSLHGRMYHRVGSLLPVAGHPRAFAQLYTTSTTPTTTPLRCVPAWQAAGLAGWPVGAASCGQPPAAAQALHMCRSPLPCTHRR